MRNTNNEICKSCKLTFVTVLALPLSLTVPSVAAQSDRVGSAAARADASAIMEEVTVTARKRDERLQDVPLAVTALGAAQIEAKKVRNLEDLTVGIPNVSFDDVGTLPGTANFSIRGLGINSSIPSIDPTVGTFVDGVYMGTNAGIIFDVFDLASIEVLRGPQGTLFGKNVTGGAVLINTRRPGEEFVTRAQTAVESGRDGGLNTYVKGSIGGPVADALGLQLSAYYNDDQGWFENKFDGEDFGKREQFMIRPVLVWSPSSKSELILRYEYADINGDGPPAQSHTNGSGVPGSPRNFDRDSFDFSIDNRGYVESKSHFLAAEFNMDIGQNGQITNIFGYRDLKQDLLSDLDAQPVTLFDGRFQIESEQFSNELRYAWSPADSLNIVTGVYYFTNDLLYAEGRKIFGGALTQDGGGDYSVESVAAFVSADYALAERWELTTGLRYTTEEKSVKVASLPLNTNAPCDVVAGTCNYDFEDTKDWGSLSPKVGISYLFSDDARAYLHWTRAHRSGGYNLRNTAVDTVNFGPGPFDQEEISSFELGFKSQWHSGRLNAALFHTTIEDMQREVQLADPNQGIVQLIRNTADAELLGIEVEGVFQLTDNFAIDASLGVLDAKYTDVLFDLNGDGVIDGRDKRLDLPRAPELTYAIGIVHDFQIGSWATASWRMSYAYRDESAFTDDNRGYILEQDVLEAGIDIRPVGTIWELSFYGRNLLGSVKHGTDGQLPATLGPAPLGGTFSPLSKGRVFGAQLSVEF